MTLEHEFENQLLIRQLRSLHTQMLEEEDLNKKRMLMEKPLEKKWDCHHYQKKIGLVFLKDLVSKTISFFFLLVLLLF